jgi:predicted DCC family thiol-disulfide oxidoreductase YuxK
MSSGDATPGHTLIYDGDCGICRRSVDWVRKADRDGRIELLPYQAPSVEDRFSGIPLEDMESAMQLVAPDGRRWQGARAAEEVLRILPGWKLLAPFFRVPGVRWVAGLVYRTVARNRRRLGCGEHCGLPGAAEIEADRDAADD